VPGTSTPDAAAGRAEKVQPLGRTSTTRLASRNLSQNQLSGPHSPNYLSDLNTSEEHLPAVWTDPSGAILRSWLIDLNRAIGTEAL